MLLINSGRSTVQAEEAVHPVSDTCKTAVRVNRNSGRSAENFLGIEYIVDLLVLQKSVSVNTRAGNIEVSSGKRSSGRNFISDLVLEVTGDLGNCGQIHTVGSSAERSILNSHSFNRTVTCTLTDTKHRAVDGSATVKPSSGSIGNDLIEVVVTVPLQETGGKSRIMRKTVDNTRNASGKRRAGIAYAKSHSITSTKLNIYLGILAQLTKLLGKGNNKSVEVSSCNIFKMATGTNTLIKNALNNAKVLIHSLLTVKSHLIIYMIVGAGNENTRLLNSQLLNKLKILFICSDPACYLGKLISQIHTFLKSPTVLLGVNEELTLTDQTLGTSQLMEQLEYINDLLHGKRRSGLLTVTESSIGHPDLVGSIHGNKAVVKCHLRNSIVFKKMPVKIGRLSVLKRELIVRLLQKISAVRELQDRLRIVKLIVHNNISLYIIQDYFVLIHRGVSRDHPRHPKNITLTAQSDTKIASTAIIAPSAALLRFGENRQRAPQPTIRYGIKNIG